MFGEDESEGSVFDAVLCVLYGVDLIIVGIEDFSCVLTTRNDGLAVGCVDRCHSAILLAVPRHH